MKSISTEIKYAVIFTIASIAWQALGKALGFHDEKIASQLVFTSGFFVVAIAIYVMALLAKRKQLGGYATYGQLFLSGTLLGVFVAILSPIATYLLLEVISPNYLQNLSAYAVQQGEATPEIAATMFTLKSYIIQGVVGAVFAGLITSAVLSLFIKRTAPVRKESIAGTFQD